MSLKWMQENVKTHASENRTCGDLKIAPGIAMMCRQLETLAKGDSVKLTAEERALLGQVSAATLEEYTINITREVRLSGSPEERRAFRYIGRMLRRWGFDIEEHRPECWTSWPGAALLEILGDRPVSIRCITHSMAASTPPDGLILDLVDAATGASGRDLVGRAVLTDGLAMPAKVFPLELAGAAAEIFMCGDHFHEMITSIVWGSPTHDDARLLPKIPIVSVTREGGEQLRKALAQGPVRVRIRTQVETCWRPLSVLIANLRTPRSHGDFVLFSGHVDSWHYGAMDNGSANATQLEVARIMAGRRQQMKRDLRLAFWSGHSHGRYAGSAWYADHFWHDLHEHCVLHVNVDSVGAQGATLLSEAIVMAEARDFASAAVEKVVGQRLSGARPKRAGDQSFWGHGIPSVFMTLSEQPADDSETAKGFAQLMGGQAKTGGLGWWWHTTEDTLDKLHPECLVRDAQVYALAVRQALEAAILPFDYGDVVTEARTLLQGYAREAKRRFDLAPVFALLDELEAALRQLTRLMQVKSIPARAAEMANACLMTLGRELIPINYCRAGIFEHDTTLAVPPFPGLEPMRQLGLLPIQSDEARQLQVALVRERNKVCHHLGNALAMVHATIAVWPTVRQRRRK